MKSEIKNTPKDLPKKYPKGFTKKINRLQKQHGRCFQQQEMLQ